MKNDYINLAYEQSLLAYRNDEVPVGAVIVMQHKVIASAYNQKVNTKNVCSHAEILAINEASKEIGDWRLNDCEMYVTLEPCPMCAGAIEQSRIRKVYIGAHSLFSTNGEIMDNIFKNYEYNHQVDYEYINDERCSKILTDFFANLRQKK